MLPILEYLGGRPCRVSFPAGVREMHDGKKVVEQEQDIIAVVPASYRPGRLAVQLVFSWQLTVQLRFERLMFCVNAMPGSFQLCDIYAHLSRWLYQRMSTRPTYL